MKQRSKNYIILGLVLILVGVCFMRFRYINNKYPEAPLEKFTLNETFDYEGVQLSVEESRLVNDDELKIVYASIEDPFPDEEKKAIFVKVNFKNNSEETKTIEAYEFDAESVSWHNGLNLELFEEVNKEDDASPVVELKPGEEKELILPYSMIERHFDEETWKALKNRKFYLTLEMYPVKRCVELNFS